MLVWEGVGIKGLDSIMAFDSCCGCWKFGTFVQERTLEMLPYEYNGPCVLHPCFDEYYRSKIKISWSVVFHILKASHEVLLQYAL